MARLYATLLRGAAAVVGQRGVVFDGGDFEAAVLKGGDGGFAAGAGALDADFDFLEAVLFGLGGALLSSAGGGEGGALAGALEADGAGRVPSEGFAVDVGDGDLGIVERSLHMGDALDDVLSDFLFASFGHGGILCGGLRIGPCDEHG